MAAAPSRVEDASSFVRRVERDRGVIALEVASRRFRKEGVSTEISLVGVVHIGRPEYYRAVEAHLGQHELVLYESVTPRGAVAIDADAVDPVRTTRDRMLFLRRVMVALRDADRATAVAAVDGVAPRAEAANPPIASDPSKESAREAPSPRVPSIDDAIARAHTIDSRFAPWMTTASIDAWGRVLAIEHADDGSFVLVSLGADGQPGGEGVAADIRLRTPADRRSTRSADEALQPQLAAMLGLAFQLTAVDYGHPSWHVADMSEGELMEALAKEGIDGGPFLRTISGSSLTASLASASISLIRLADGLSGGRIRAFVMMVLIETLSLADEKVIAAGFPEGFARVILDRRNDVAFNALRERLASKDLASIAVFYGAAHMPDLERRLRRDGWTKTDEQWFEGFSLDPAASGLDAASVEEFRRMLREMLASVRAGGSTP